MQEIISEMCTFLIEIIYWYITLFFICPWIFEIYYHCTAYKLSDLFIATKNKNRIYQYVSLKGKKSIKKIRKKHKNQPLNIKLYAAAKFVKQQILIAFPNLSVNTLYTTRTHEHIKEQIEKEAKKGYFKIHNIDKEKERYIFLESFMILGLKDTVLIFIKKEYRHNLKKQFYIITFTRIK